MLLDVIYSICFNICLLVVLAFMMTKMDFVQRLLLNEEGGSEEGRGESVWQRLWEKVLLGVIFGVFCIISDYIGIQVTGALPNARVIGVLSAGFLGGPVSGFITTAIAAAHRYLIFPERISTVAVCSPRSSMGSSVPLSAGRRRKTASTRIHFCLESRSFPR